MAKELEDEKILKLLKHLGLLKKKKKKKVGTPIPTTSGIVKKKKAIPLAVGWGQGGHNPLNLIGLPPTKSVIIKDTSGSHGRFESRQEGIRQPPQIIYIRNTEPVNVMNPSKEGYSIYDGDGVTSSYTAPLKAQMPVADVGHLSVGGKGGGGGTSHHSHLEPIIGSRQRVQEEEERTTFDNVQPMPISKSRSPYPTRTAPPLPYDALPPTEALYTGKRRGRPPGSKNKPKVNVSDSELSDDFEDTNTLKPNVYSFGPTQQYLNQLKKNYVKEL